MKRKTGQYSLESDQYMMVTNFNIYALSSSHKVDWGVTMDDTKGIMKRIFGKPDGKLLIFCEGVDNCIFTFENEARRDEFI